MTARTAMSARCRRRRRAPDHPCRVGRFRGSARANHCSWSCCVLEQSAWPTPEISYAGQLLRRTDRRLGARLIPDPVLLARRERLERCPCGARRLRTERGARASTVRRADCSASWLLMRRWRERRCRLRGTGDRLEDRDGARSARRCAPSPAAIAFSALVGVPAASFCRRSIDVDGSAPSSVRRGARSSRRSWPEPCARLR